MDASATNSNNTVTERNTCKFCNKDFSTGSNRNKHMKSVHGEVNEDLRSKHILCPACTEDDVPLQSYNDLEKHLNDEHGIDLDYGIYEFSSKSDYNDWTKEEKISVRFALRRTIKKADYVEKDYICNRSNAVGYESRCVKRIKKTKDPIKIHGVCPSRLKVRFFDKGNIILKFCYTHVGHEDEIKYLSEEQKKMIVENLETGMTVDQIIQNTRLLKTSRVERINMLTRKDVSYLAKKHNIDIRKSHSDIDAETSKSHAWNVKRNLQENMDNELETEPRSLIKEYSEEEIAHLIIKEPESIFSTETEKQREMDFNAIRNFLTSLDEEAYKQSIKRIFDVMKDEECKSESKK